MSTPTQEPPDVVVSRVLETVARQLHRFFKGRVPVPELMSLGAAGATDALARWDGRGTFEPFAAQRIEWAILRELKRQSRRDDRASFRNDVRALTAAEDATERRVRRSPPCADEGSSFVDELLQDMASGFTVEIMACDPDTVRDAESDVERDAERLRVRRVAKGLPETMADLIHRYYCRGETLEEMAEDLGLQKSTVFDRLNRALDQLRERLSPGDAGAEVVPLRRT